MYCKKIHLLIFLNIFCLLLAEEGASIYGIISDRQTGYPLVAVNVFLKDTKTGAMSDESGSYSIRNIPPGSYELITSMIGYEHHLEKIKLSPGDRIELNIRMKQIILDYGENVLVTASRTQKIIEEIPGSVDLIDNNTLSMINPQNVGEALQNIKGVMIKSYGGLGASQTISLRGSSSEQVLILIDGQRVNNAQNGQVDLSNLPSHEIERIEIVKGANSALYGSDAVGGVINIITRKPGNNNNVGVSVKSTLGSFSSYSMESALNYTKNNLILSTVYKYLSSLGNFSYTDNYGMQQQRVNSDISSHSFTTRIGYVFTFWDNLPEIDLKYSHYQSEKGVPGTIEPYYYQARMWDRNDNVSLNVYSKIINQFHTIRFMSSYQTTLNRYSNDEMLVPTDNSFRTNTLNTELQGHSVVNQYLMLTYGIGQQSNAMNNQQLDTTYQRFTWYAFLLNESNIRFSGYFLKSLIITPSIRYDNHSDFNSIVSPKIGFVLNMGEKWKTGIKSNFGLSYRSPTFNDLYWPEDPYTVGNPNLKPESGRDWDFGTRMQFPVLGGLYLENVYFHNHLTDLIIWESNGNKWTPDNVDQALIRGFENDLRLNIIKGYLSSNFNYTFLRAINLSDNTNEYGKQLAYRPRHTINASVTGSYRIFTLQYLFNYTGKRYTDRTNVDLNALNPYSISDLILGVRPQLNNMDLYLNFQIKNLFNANYRIMKNLPMPGREYRMSIEVKLNKKPNKGECHEKIDNHADSYHNCYGVGWM